MARLRNDSVYKRKSIIMVSRASQALNSVTSDSNVSSARNTNDSDKPSFIASSSPLNNDNIFDSTQQFFNGVVPTPQRKSKNILSIKRFSHLSPIECNEKKGDTITISGTSFGDSTPAIILEKKNDTPIRIGINMRKKPAAVPVSKKDKELPILTKKPAVAPKNKKDKELPILTKKPAVAPVNNNNKEVPILEKKKAHVTKRPPKRVYDARDEIVEKEVKRKKSPPPRRTYDLRPRKTQINYAELNGKRKKTMGGASQPMSQKEENPEAKRGKKSTQQKATKKKK